MKESQNIFSMVVNRRFSLLMSVYAGERAEFLREALNSLSHAVEFPAEIILVEDGPLGDDLTRVIDGFRARLPIRSVKLDVNQGLASALNAGLAQCSYQLVARFDSDDLCLPHRFSEQINFMLGNSDVAASSCWVEEFDSDVDAMRTMRALPISHDELVRFGKMRNPLNHPAVMFRKAAVEQVGGYQEEVAFEDYSLWLRLILAGYRLANLPVVLVRMRAGAAQMRRRGGLRYARCELKFAMKFRQIGFFSTYEFLRFIVLRVPFRLLAAPLLLRAYQILGRVTSNR